MDDLGTIISIVTSISSTVLAGIVLKRYEEENRRRSEERKRRVNEAKALEKGVESLLRDRLSRGIEHYLEEGFVPIHEAKIFEMMYIAYHNLGGNDVITAMYKKFLLLPHSKDCMK